MSEARLIFIPKPFDFKRQEGESTAAYHERIGAAMLERQRELEAWVDARWGPNRTRDLFQLLEEPIPAVDLAKEICVVIAKRLGLDPKGPADKPNNDLRENWTLFYNEVHWMLLELTDRLRHERGVPRLHRVLHHEVPLDRVLIPALATWAQDTIIWQIASRAGVSRETTIVDLIQAGIKAGIESGAYPWLTIKDMEPKGPK